MSTMPQFGSREFTSLIEERWLLKKPTQPGQGYNWKVLTPEEKKDTEQKFREWEELDSQQRHNLQLAREQIDRQLWEKFGYYPKIWDTFHSSDLIFAFQPTTTGNNTTWGKDHPGYAALINTPRVGRDHEEQICRAQKLGLLDDTFQLTNNGKSLLRYLCSNMPLRTFAEMLMAYQGVNFSQFEAKPYEMDQHSLNDYCLWRQIWQTANDYGLLQALEEQLEFSNFALYATKLPDWATPRNRWEVDKFRPFFIRHLKQWFVKREKFRTPAVAL